MDDIQMERRMVTVEIWQANHERLCAERFLALRQDIRWVLGGVAAVVITVMGWMAIQLYHNVTDRAPAPSHVELRAR